MKYAYYCEVCDEIYILNEGVSNYHYFFHKPLGNLHFVTLVGHESYPESMQDWQIKADARNYIENFGVTWKPLVMTM